MFDLDRRVAEYAYLLDLTIVQPMVRVTLARDMRSTVRQWTEILTCDGIGSSKALAKLANHIAKGEHSLNSFSDLSADEARAYWFPRVQLEDIWGVGRAGTGWLLPWGAARLPTSRRWIRASSGPAWPLSASK